ncbi:type II toxin-antitoxin system VapC family toxin [Steroidobacter sp. S1-65]|uniref:Ribonuclease VapC n=1 Tax=Steroidobacter gossypii TaxID=2805490 RepID=A0ABS1WWR8_9GAMM|nr:type II toxin-antitoxin system VapC family toxin [Steroidobacter gossypii]MBM0105408.1 type II toxin-antitoxin system VapC family toxin [Steroidobacter gossypii]
MYLVDTDVIREARKGDKANAGVHEFFRNAARDDVTLFLSVVTIGEMRQGVENIRRRGDKPQADCLERWLDKVTTEFSEAILSFDEEAAQVWGRLRSPHPENPLDKQIAATALIYDLTVVTRNSAHCQPTGVRILDPLR